MRGLLVIAFLFVIRPTFAQIPANPIGLNPSHLRWQQIETPQVRIIFPESMGVQAQRVANLTTFLHQHNNTSIGQQIRPVTILLQNQPALSNGLVTVGPFRSEFFTTPPQFDCTTDWLDQLTIHEYRHVKQFGNAQRGLTRLAKGVFGSWGWGGLMATALPRWYFEGDAVVAETSLSNSGRGRMPHFLMESRALLAADRHYGYEKMAARSLKDYVPDWYQLGYQQLAYGRMRFGEDLWAGVMQDAVRYRGLFYPFSRSLQQATGMRTPAFFDASWAYLDSMDQARPKPVVLPIWQLRPMQKSTVTHITNPQYLSDASMIMEVSGFDRINTLIRMDEKGKIKQLTTTGIRLNQQMSALSAAEDIVCWAELGFHPRWGNLTYSNIWIYNIKDAQKKQLTKRTRLYAPALSRDGKKIVAIQVSHENEAQLVILDAQNGDQLQEIPNPDNDFYSYPCWSSDGRSIVAVAKANEQHRLVRIAISSEISTTMVPASHYQLSHPVVAGDTIYFSAAYSGVNNIYAATKPGGVIYQLTDDPLGAFQPAVSTDRKKLSFSSFSVEGYDVKELSLQDALWRNYSMPEQSPFDFANILNQQSGGSIIGQVPADTFKQKPFKKWTGLINPHSWTPFIADPEAGAEVYFDNKFGTFSATAAALYNYNESTWGFSSEVRFAEWYPVLSAGFDQGERAAVFFNFQPADDSLILQRIYAERWQEKDISFGINLPLNFSKGSFFSRLNTSVNYHYLSIDPNNSISDPNTRIDTIPVGRGGQNQFQELFRDPISADQLSALEFNLSYSMLRRRALQHLNPRWGVRLGLNYRTTLSSNLGGSVFWSRADLFLPGFLRNHSTLINGMFQQQGLLDNYRFGNYFFYPRGYPAITRDELYKLGINYALPLFYPDVAIGPLAFIKRIKANLFYDHGWLKTTSIGVGSTQQLRSAGIELRTDFRAFRLLEIDLGIRYSYLLDVDENFPPGYSRHQFNFLLISITE